jgi:hypothetical protein
VVQVEESAFQIEPLTFELQLAPDECAEFLLVQGRGYELRLLSQRACD